MLKLQQSLRSESKPIFRLRLVYENTRTTVPLYYLHKWLFPRVFDDGLTSLVTTGTYWCIYMDMVTILHYIVIIIYGWAMKKTFTVAVCVFSFILSVWGSELGVHKCDVMFNTQLFITAASLTVLCNIWCLNASDINCICIALLCCWSSQC